MPTEADASQIFQGILLKSKPKWKSTETERQLFSNKRHDGLSTSLDF